MKNANILNLAALVSFCIMATGAHAAAEPLQKKAAITIKNYYFSPIDVVFHEDQTGNEVSSHVSASGSSGFPPYKFVEQTKTIQFQPVATTVTVYGIAYEQYEQGKPGKIAVRVRKASFKLSDKQLKDIKSIKITEKSADIETKRGRQAKQALNWGPIDVSERE